MSEIGHKCISAYTEGSVRHIQEAQEQTTLIRFNFLMGEINELYHMLAMRAGLSDSVMSILYVLWEKDGCCPQNTIVKQTGIPRQTINSALQKLEREGITEITSGEGRNTIVHLTEAGQALCREKVAPIFKMEEEVFHSWTEKEQESYLQLNRRYLAEMREKVKEQ